MTIRYKCEECDSVLKIRDELAGTDGKCPKCETSFTIPTPEKRQKVAVGAGTAGASQWESEDLVDMPREITPMPDLSGSDEFDAMGAVSGSDPANSAEPAAGEAIKPSIAELMREHEASKKKRKGADKKKKGSLAEAAAAAEVLTSGSAADALTRTYDQKRGKAGEPPPITREERRELERKAALLDFGKKGGIGLAVLAVLLYFLISYMTAEPLPDLIEVSGVVSVQGTTQVGVEVRFAPAADPNANSDDLKKQEKGMRSSSSGTTDEDGRYYLWYNKEEEIPGAVPGRHNITIQFDNGVQFNLPPEFQQKTIPDDGVEINFHL